MIRARRIQDTTSRPCHTLIQHNERCSGICRRGGGGCTMEIYDDDGLDRFDMAFASIMIACWVCDEPRAKSRKRWRTAMQSRP